jgi:phosphoribosyl-ATP pyrophosphohydrolase
MQKFDFEELYRIIRQKILSRNSESYSYRLFKSPKLLYKKILEEAMELTKTKNKKQVVWEASDLIYFMTVFLVKRKVSFSQIKRKLKQRNREKMRRRKKVKITIISSFAKDTIIKKDFKEARSGGPALFIERFIRKKRIPYEIYAGRNGVVEIYIKNKKEIGKIIKVYKIPQIKEKKRFVIISTLLDEYALKAIGEFSCLDVQGYVQSKNKFGAKRLFNSKEIEKFNIVKGTKEELRFIPKKILGNVEVVLKTKGKKGFEVTKNKKNYIFDAEEIKSQDTIGAGDTLFAAFCVKYYSTKNIRESAEFAMREVNRFLQEKLK